MNDATCKFGAQRAARPSDGRFIRMPFLLLLLVVLVGCRSTSTESPPHERGTIVIAIAMEDTTLPAADPTMQVTLTQRNHKVRKQQSFAGGTTTIAFDNLPMGRWSVEVLLLDDQGVAVYEGADELFIGQDDTTHAHIVLTPKPGAIVVSVDMGTDCVPVRDGLCLADAADLGRVNTSPGSKQSGAPDNHNFDWEPGQRTGTIELTSLDNMAPGTYDLQLIFYMGTRNNVLLEGQWAPVEVRPGATTVVGWHPETGALQLELQLHTPPAAPATLSGQFGADGVRLTWSPSTDDVTSYNVYRRRGTGEPFTLIHVAEGLVTEWTDADAPPCEQLTDEKLHYAVTATNDAGYESLRSPVAGVCEL